MKKILLTIAFALIVSIGFSQTVNPHTEKVHSYKKKNGTHVAGYTKTAPNHTTKDNYSHKGNTNPRTGKRGYKK